MSSDPLVMHTTIMIDDTPVMFSDVFAGMGWEHRAGNNVSLTIVGKDQDKLARWFSKLKEGGTVHMDLQETFWTKLYGSLRDKFGIEWQFSVDAGAMTT